MRCSQPIGGAVQGQLVGNRISNRLPRHDPRLTRDHRQRPRPISSTQATSSLPRHHRRDGRRHPSALQARPTTRRSVGVGSRDPDSPSRPRPSQCADQEKQSLLRESNSRPFPYHAARRMHSGASLRAATGISSVGGRRCALLCAPVGSQDGSRPLPHRAVRRHNQCSHYRALGPSQNAGTRVRWPSVSEW